jgi:hypothetical protein
MKWGKKGDTHCTWFARMPSPQPPSTHTVGGRISEWALAIIVAVSAVLRLIMCERGGQLFFGDELRYDRGVRLYFEVTRGDWAAVREMMAMPEHALFPWVGAAVTWAQRVLSQGTNFGDWAHHPEYATFTMWIGACVLSLFSTLNVVLVHGLARAAGADREEALWATLLMAVSNTAFYYARHLLPYDCALSAALAALLIGMGSPTETRAALCGILAGLAYHIYNGYWFLPPVVALAVAVHWRGNARVLRLLCALTAGLLLGVGLPLLVGTIAGGAQYWRTMAAFSRTVTQGSFAEGWSLPWAYLWSSEDWLGAAVGACIIAVLVTTWSGRHRLERRISIWMSALGMAYGLLLVTSVVMERFVVYGRTVKPLVPLLCLMGGWAVHRLVAQRRWLKVLAAAALVASGFVHFAPHFTRVFPRDVEVAVLRQFGNPKRTLSVSGSIYIPLALPVTRGDLALVNAQMLYPIRGYIGFPQGQTLFRIGHPLTYGPFQYEGHTPAERAILQTQDISIRLMRLPHPGQVPDDLPFPLRYQNSDRRTGN